MLERALGFFFERSVHSVDPDVRMRRQVTTFRAALQTQLHRAAAALPAPGGHEALPKALATPFLPVALSLDPHSEQSPVIEASRPPMTQVAELRTFHEALQAQATAADQLLASLTERVLQGRQAVSLRLKALSPLLYEHGVRMAAAAQAPTMGIPLVLDAKLLEAAIATTKDNRRQGVLQQLADIAKPSVHSLQVPTAPRAAAHRLWRALALWWRSWLARTASRRMLPGQAQDAAPLDARFATYEALAADWARSAHSADTNKAGEPPPKSAVL